MKLLLIGGTGVLSSAITNEALKQNIEVFMINRGNNTSNIPNDVTLFKSDINDTNRIINFLKGKHFDAIVDCICYNTNQLIHSFKLFSNYCNQYIFISSAAVYNTLECSECVEDSPKKLPLWSYSLKKVDCEEKLVSLSKQSNTPYTIIRPCVTYGNTRIPYGITPKYGYHGTLIHRILNNKPIITWNGGVNKCNITRVEDFAIGFVGLIGNRNAYNNAINIVGDKTYSWIEVLDSISKCLNKDIIKIDIPSDFYAQEFPAKKEEILGGRSLDLIVNNDKLKSLVPNFMQKITLNEGIMKTIDHYKNNNYLNGIDYRFDADTDRIIIKYLKRIGNNKGYNLNFINYIGNKNIKNRVNYFLERYKDIILIRFLIFSIKASKYILRKTIKKIISK